MVTLWHGWVLERTCLFLNLFYDDIFVDILLKRSVGEQKPRLSHCLLIQARLYQMILRTVFTVFTVSSASCGAPLVLFLFLCSPRHWPCRAADWSTPDSLKLCMHSFPRSGEDGLRKWDETARSQRTASIVRNDEHHRLRLHVFCAIHMHGIFWSHVPLATRLCSTERFLRLALPRVVIHNAYTWHLVVKLVSMVA